MTEETQDTSIESLLEQLQNSKDSLVRGWAADLLVEQAKDNEPILGALRKAAQHDPSKLVRDAANSSLRKLGEKVEQPNNWLSIGIWAGVIPGVLLLFIFPRGQLVILFLIGSTIGIPFGLIGAYMGRRSVRTAWIVAILGMIVGVALFVWFAIATCLICQ